MKKHKRSEEIVNEDQKFTSPAGKIPYYPLAVKKGSGAIIEDADGNEFIDILSSAAALNTGHAHPKVVNAIVNQVQDFIHYTPVYMYHEPAVELAKKLIEITPGDHPKRVSFGLSGSDANDGLIKFARAYTGRSKIISFIGSYHGSTYGAISLSAISLNMRRKMGPFVPEIYHMPYPDCYRCQFGQTSDNCSLECLEYLKTALDSYIPKEEVAAVVIEPIAGDAGIIVPPRKYMEALYKLCQDNGILFVSEEVQQGFGRTGKWFGIEHFNIVPDAVILAKSIASGMPLSAIVARAEILESLDAPAHLFTTFANPACCQASLATIDVVEEEELKKKSEALGNYAMERFEQMKQKYDLIGQVRGLGLSIGVDLVKDQTTKEKAQTAAAKICYRAWEQGVVLSFFAGSVLRIQPPLVTSKEQLDQALDVIEQSIEAYLNGEIPDEVLETVKGW